MTRVSLHLKNQYVSMRDGIRLAVSVWLSDAAASLESSQPAVVVTTRYWRAIAFLSQDLESQVYYSLAATLCPQGYALVVADARGSGASSGHRRGEATHEEVLDIGELIAWVGEQVWCDGRVATTGTSYSANTTLLSLITAPKALKFAVCRAPDFDVYRHLLAPGGLVNHWFVESWGRATAAQDRNDLEFLIAEGYLSKPKGAKQPLGVMPVDEDRCVNYGAEESGLAEAIKDHRRNYNLETSMESLAYIDSDFFTCTRTLFNPTYRKAIEQSGVPLVIRCGWHDAGTALGALCMYASFDMPLRIILGPWNHDGSYFVDPMEASKGTEIDFLDSSKARVMTLQSLDERFKTMEIRVDSSRLRSVEYYTLGQGVWKATEQWPPSTTQIQRWYLAEKQLLTTESPAMVMGYDNYKVDFTATTGRHNRWYAQTSEQPILFPDRCDEDRKLLVYDSAPLQRDMEITGHPVISLFVRSSGTDGQFFVYLETIDPDGRVRLLTEGQLRGIHRKVSKEKPPYKMFGPFHSFKKEDIQPLSPGEVTEIKFELFPISVLLPKGQRLRLAIAGADTDVFAPPDNCGNLTIYIERNAVFASFIDLPVIKPDVI